MTDTTPNPVENITGCRNSPLPCKWMSPPWAQERTLPIPCRIKPQRQRAGNRSVWISTRIPPCSAVIWCLIFQIQNRLWGRRRGPPRWPSISPPKITDKIHSWSIHDCFTIIIGVFWVFLFCLNPQSSWVGIWNRRAKENDGQVIPSHRRSRRAGSGFVGSSSTLGKGWTTMCDPLQSLPTALLDWVGIFTRSKMSRYSKISNWLC